MNQHLERLELVSPIIQQPVVELIRKCQEKLNRTLLVVHGWRSVQEQMLIYQKGRTFVRETGTWEISDPKAVVTKLSPGKSAHNVITRQGTAAALAVDLIPLLPDGKPDWNVGMDFWNPLYSLAWRVGLDPLGDSVGSYLKGDLGHFEEPGWPLKLDGLDLLLPMGEHATAFV